MIADITVTEKSFGSKSLYRDLHMSIQAGEKVGLIGRNGVGKSTLLGIMNGTDTDFTGDIAYRRGLVVISTRQEHHGLGERSVLEYILDDLPEYAALKHITDTYPLTMGEDMRLITEYSEALARFDDLGYYTIEDSIIRELANFQIDDDKARGRLGDLSGGQKRLVEVVKIMHASAQLALIDEPTNHMDYIAKAQFIAWMRPSARQRHIPGEELRSGAHGPSSPLRSGARSSSQAAPLSGARFDTSKMAMLIITHDRDVLGQMDRIVEIKDGRAHSFDGNYQAYLRQNTASTTTQMHDYEMTQRQITNLKAKVVQFRRLKEKARDPDTIKQFKRRETEAAQQLAEQQAITKPTFWIDRESADNLNYKVGENYQKFKAKNIKIQGMNEADSHSSRLLVTATDVSLGYSAPLFAGVSFQLREGEQIELRGRNGAGKTTMIKAILAQAAGHQPSTLLAGEISIEPHLSIGIYEQEIASQYFELSLAAAIERLYLDRQLSISNQKINQLLHSYLFTLGDGATPIAQLSGGQKARFQLISMLASDPQLLILDEPTNHLDLPSIEELELALQKYTGAIIYVSHDDHFRQKLTAEVIEVA